MKEIKFRAWTGKNMIYSGSSLELDNQLDLFFCGISEYKGVMQYTGLKDKNGQEIYESDIVKTHKNYVFTVIFWKGSFWLDYKDGSFDEDTALQLVSSQNVLGEVIGNIYENPELLK